MEKYPELALSSILEGSPGQGLADPFPMTVDSSTFIFYEHIRGEAQHGDIRFFELSSDGSVRQTGLALRKQHHLSYPQIFPWQGRLYMLVESAATRDVALSGRAIPRRVAPRDDVPGRGCRIRSDLCRIQWTLVALRERAALRIRAARRAAHLLRQAAARSLDAAPDEPGQVRSEIDPSRWPTLCPRRQALPTSPGQLDPLWLCHRDQPRRPAQRDELR